MQNVEREEESWEEEKEEYLVKSKGDNGDSFEVKKRGCGLLFDIFRFQYLSRDDFGESGESGLSFEGVFEKEVNLESDVGVKMRIRKTKNEEEEEEEAIDAFF